MPEYLPMTADERNHLRTICAIGAETPRERLDMGCRVCNEIDAWRRRLPIAPTEDTASQIDALTLVHFIDGRILAARELRRGISTEDERRGHSREQALQEVRVKLTGERLAADVRCEHDWPAWHDTLNDGEQTRLCRRCEAVDYRQAG